MWIARHLGAEEIWLCKVFISTAQFHLRKQQPLVGTVKVINLKGVPPIGYEIACLLYQSTTTELQHLLSISNGYLAFELIA